MTTALKQEIKKIARASVREAIVAETSRLQAIERLYRRTNSIPSVWATPEEVRAIKRGRAQFARGEYSALSEVLHEMENISRKRRSQKSRKNSH